MSDRDSDNVYESGRNRSDDAFNQQQERYGAGVDALGAYQRGQDIALAAWATARDEPQRSRSYTPSAPSSSSEGWESGGGDYSVSWSSPALAAATARYERRKHAPMSPLRVVGVPLLIVIALLAMRPGALTLVLATVILVKASDNALKMYHAWRASTTLNNGCRGVILEHVPSAPTVTHVPPYAVLTTAPETRVWTIGLTTCLQLGLILTPSLLVVGAESPSASSRATTTSVVTSNSHSKPSWLVKVNLYRTAAGLAPMTDQPAWDIGLKHHLRYMALTPKRYFTGPYQSLHTENPGSPYYTKDGSKEAGASDLLPGYAGYGGGTAIRALDYWLQAPFHAIGMLRPQLRQVALAYDPSTGSAGLDVISGLDGRAPRPTKPTLFPGPRMATDLTTFPAGGEWPNPLETCGWTTVGTVGLPLIALLLQDPSSTLSASLTGPARLYETSQRGDLCIVDDHTYRSSNGIYGPNGKRILTGDHAVYLIPRLPLNMGAYHISINQPGLATIAWSFQVQPTTIHVPGDEATIAAALGDAQPGDTVQLGGGAFAGNLTVPDYVRLRGVGIDRTRILGAGHGRVITLGAGSILERLSVTGSGKDYWDAGVFIGDKAGTIRQIHSYGNSIGIAIYCFDALCKGQSIVSNAIIDDNENGGVLVERQAFRAVNDSLVNNGQGFGGQFGSGTVIENSIVVGNKAAGISSDVEARHLTVAFNDLYRNGDDYVGVKPGPGSRSIDPLFVNMPTGNFHLAANSGCIHGADPVLAIAGYKDQGQLGAYGNMPTDAHR